MKYSKEKDSTPVETVNKIKNILSDIKIIPAEKDWQNIISSESAQPFYVKRLFFNDDSIGTNGKGTSQEYCLASAYAEFMERLQNLYLPSRIEANIPDTKFIPQNKFYNNEKYQIFFRDLYEKENQTDKNTPIETIIKNLQSFVSMDENSDLECVPFYSVNNKEVVYLPLRILTQINTTNGMSAGNTPQEAIIQGLCEIIERYVQKRIYLEKLNCPIIDEKEYLCFDEISKMVSLYNSMGINIQVRDASLNEKWPAICIIFIDTKTGKYTSKFSASTSFPIAIERCLTEYAQCQDLTINKTYSMPHYNLCSDKDFFDYETVEKINIFNTYSFQFPLEFFLSNNYSWEYQKNETFAENQSNTENLNRLMNVIKEHSFDVYVRDVSFLGFPAFHIHIPEMSNFLINVTREFENEIKIFKPYLAQYVNNFDLKFLVAYLFNFTNPINLAINLQNKNYDLALEYIDKIINSNNNIPIALNCLQQYIKLKIANYRDNDIQNILSQFYTQDVVNSIYNYCINTNYIENIAKEIAMNINASQNTEQYKTYKKTTDYMCKILSEKYMTNIPNQENLKNIFEQ